MMRLLRRFYRIVALIYWIIHQGIVSLPISRQKDRKKAVREMALQTRIWGAGLLRIFGVKLNITGDISHYREKGGLVVSNHLGYLDIFVHATCFGLRFTPKKDIRKWPFFGWYTDITIPIWIDRETRSKSGETLELFRETLKDNVPLIIYPEGTSTDGASGVLPFKPTSFETTVNTEIPIQPILTLYSVSPGELSPCWYGDQTFLPHIWALLGNKQINADIYILPLVYAEGRDRKQLALHVHDIIQDAYDHYHNARRQSGKEPDNE